MTDVLNRRLVPSKDAATSAVGDETVILDLRSGIYYGLDRVSTEIWKLLGSGYQGDAICRSVAERYAIELATAQADVRSFLADLEGRGLLVDA